MVQDSPINVVITDADYSVILNADQCKEAYSEKYDKLVAKVEEYLKSTILGEKILRNTGTN